MTLSRDARWLAAAIQMVIAWEWLVSGTNKVLSGAFPQGLASALDEGLQNNPNGWYVSLLQGIVLPHSVAFGYAIETMEIMVGMALLIGAIVLVGPVRHRGMPQYRLAVGEIAAATVAALVGMLLCINFHFFMGDGIIPWINSTRPFDEGISLDTLMPPLSAIILVLNARMLVVMTGMPIAQHLRRGVDHLRGLLGGARHGRPQVADSQ